MDNPIPLLYKKFDVLEPNARFILTTRPMDDWLISVRWLFERELPKLNKALQKVANEIHQEFYGTTQFETNLFVSNWNQ